MTAPRKITRREATRLLDRSGPSGHHAVAHVLAAATGSAEEAELAGEHTAAAVFRAASVADSPTSRRPSMIRTTVTKLLAAKLLAATAVAAAATGGLALAATTGALPTPSGHTHPAVTPSSGGHDGAGGPGAHASGLDVGAGSSSAAVHASATPSPSLVGLCRAYQAGATRNPGHAAHNPAFTALATAAGGTDGIGAYCTALIGAPSSHPTGAPTSHATGEPTDHPTGAPSSHPTGAPTDHPTGRPSSHPTGAPSSH